MCDSVQESELEAKENLVRELRDELGLLKESESAASNENKGMSTQVGEMKLQLERLVYESKEAAITTDGLREQNADLANELEELRVSLFLLVVKLIEGILSADLARFWLG